MREYRVVKAADIKIGDREIRPDDTGLPELWADISANGLQDPLLVDANLNLIDGLRRLKTFAADADVDVVVTDTYLDTLEVMKLSKDKPFSRPWDARRIWDFHVSTGDQRNLHHHQTSKAGIPKRKLKEVAETKSSLDNSITRRLISELAGVPQAVIQAALFLYARAYDPNKESNPELRALAQELAVKMDAGYNVYSARHDFEKARSRTKGNIVSEAEQRKILRSSTSSVSVLSRVLNDFGEINNRITKDEAEAAYKVLYQGRSDLVHILKKLKERIERG
jgi:hypothetical protein